MEEEIFKTRKRIVLELIPWLVVGFSVFIIGLYFLLKQISETGNPYNEYLLITHGVTTKGVLCDYKEYELPSPDGEGSSSYYYSWDYSFKATRYNLRSLRRTLDILDEKSSIKRSKQTDNELIKKLSDSNSSYNLRALSFLSGGKLFAKEFRSSGINSGCWPNYPKNMDIIYLNDIPIINKLKSECSKSVLELLRKKVAPLSLILAISTLIVFWLFKTGLQNFKRSMKIYDDSLKQYRASKKQY